MSPHRLFTLAVLVFTTLYLFIVGGYDSGGVVVLAYWLIYAACLWHILTRRDFETNQRILWFLVITFAPLIGIVFSWFLPAPAECEIHRNQSRRLTLNKLLDPPSEPPPSAP